MKVAILSESPADEAAIRILLSALLREAVESIPLRPRPGGWNAVVNAIHPTLMELYYSGTASALVVVIDSDDSTIHRSEHERAGSEVSNCRLCELRTRVKQVRSQLRRQQGLQEVNIALAVAVPAIEGWYLCGRQCTEAGWLLKQREGVSAKAEIDRLKRIAYGADHAPLRLLTSRAIKHAAGLASDLSVLEQFFPESFGRFAADVRSWIIR